MGKGWNGTNLQRTWLRKQGRGAKSYSLSQRPRKWFCVACNREHGPKVDKVLLLDGKTTICWRQFLKDWKPAT